jgi:hypothetical protein
MRRAVQFASLIAPHALMVRAARNFQTVDMVVPLISISMLGLTLNAAFNALRR